MVDFIYNRIYINNDAVVTGKKLRELLPNELAIYNEKGVAVTASTAEEAKFLKFAQGTEENIALQSDEIHLKKVLKARVVKGTDESQTMKAELDFTGDMHCGEDIVITGRAFSDLINVPYPGGYSVGVVASTTCCGCDADVCEALTEEEKTQVLEKLVKQLNADNILPNYITITLDGTKIVFEAKEQDNFTGVQGSFSGVKIYDLVNFYFEAKVGAETSQDMSLDSDACNDLATWTVTREPKHPQNTPAQVKRVYARYVTNNMSSFRPLPNSEKLIGEFDADIRDSVYDQIFVSAYEPQNTAWNDVVEKEFGVIIYTLPAHTAGITAILEAYGIEFE